MVATFHHYAFNHARAPEFTARPKVAGMVIPQWQSGKIFGYQRAFGYPWKSPVDQVVPGFHPVGVGMSEFEKAAKVFDALKAAEDQPAQLALPILNGLVGLVQGGSEAPLEIEEARSGAFMAICEIGKALHRGQPADQLWVSAIAATERWMSLTK